jgi:hypothetical protein
MGGAQALDSETGGIIITATTRLPRPALAKGEAKGEAKSEAKGETKPGQIRKTISKRHPECSTIMSLSARFSRILINLAATRVSRTMADIWAGAEAEAALYISSQKAPNDNASEDPWHLAARVRCNSSGFGSFCSISTLENRRCFTWQLQCLYNVTLPLEISPSVIVQLDFFHLETKSS